MEPVRTQLSQQNPGPKRLKTFKLTNYQITSLQLAAKLIAKGFNRVQTTLKIIALKGYISPNETQEVILPVTKRKLPKEKTIVST